MKKYLVIMAAIAIICTVKMGAQTISGTILDEKLGDPLIGANVVIENTSIGTTTDLDGQYQFKCDPGTYNIAISYIGYQTKVIQDVIVKDKEVTYLDISLSDEALDLGLDVTVTAKAIERSENAVLLLQKKADRIQDGISSQEMSRYSVSNAAGAMKKVTGANVEGGKYVFIRGLGDRYSITQLNDLVMPSTDPYRNSAQLDLIPTNLLDNIITSKTFTPDQPGSFTGGNVNIKTKSFPEEFSFSIGLSTAYNNQNNLIDNFLTHNSGSTSDYFGFDDGGRAMPAIFQDENVLNALNQNSVIKSRQGDYELASILDQSTKSLNREFEPKLAQTPLDHGISLGFGNQYEIFGKTLGVIAAGSFKQSYSHLDQFLKANWALETVNDDVLFNQGNYKDTQSSQNPQLNGLVGLALKLNPMNTLSFNYIYNHNTNKSTRFLFGSRPDNIVGDEQLQGRSLSFIERELSNYQLSGEHSLPKLNKATIEWKLSSVVSSQLEPMTRIFENQYNVVSEQYDLPLSNIQAPFYFFRDLQDDQKSGKLDITLPFGDKGVKFKFGTLLTQKNRNFREDRLRLDKDSGKPAAFEGNADDYLADDNVGIVETKETTSRTRYIIGNYVTTDTDPENRYVGNDNVYAYYGMLTWPLGNKFKFIGGARFEQTDLYIESGAVDKPIEERVGSIDAKDLLPSANLIYSLNDDMNLRGSYSKTIARPNMREIAPFTSLDPLERFFYNGNTQLERTLIDNIDLRWEWFTNPGELFAISGYYKKFENPIVFQYIRSASPELQYDNVPSGSLMGIEFEVRKQLGFISPILEKFKFVTNVSLIQSSLDVNTISENEVTERPFVGQPNYIVNSALNYTNIEAGWDVILSFNQIGDRLNFLGREGTPDIYDRGRGQLDLTVLKKINNVNLKFSAQNLLNDDYILSSTYKGSEFIYSKFKRGVTFGFGINYTIR